MNTPTIFSVKTKKKTPYKMKQIAEKTRKMKNGSRLESQQPKAGAIKKIMFVK